MKFCSALLFLTAASCGFAQPSTITPYAFTTLAGAAAIGSTDGPGAVARFNFPQAIAVDGAGNLYVADAANNTIRKITPAGVVSTLAGNAGYSIDPNDSKHGDGTGSDARLTIPAALALDATGNLFVAEGGNTPFRKITPAGVVTTVPSGSPNGFRNPAGIVVASSDMIYVSDTDNNTIKKITFSGGGSVTTFAGATTVGYEDGSGSAARFQNPRGLAIDATGTVYVADTENHTIRKITPAGDVTTLAGTPGTRGHTDGLGAAALFSSPNSLTIDLAGNLYVADYGNSTVRKITPSGAVTTLAGAPVTPGHIDGNFSVARFYTPQGVAVDAGGNVFVGDSRDQTIRQITPASITSTVAGLSPLQSNGSQGGNGPDARFSQPVAMAVGPGGDVYVADLQNQTIRKIAPNGFTVTFAGTAGSPGYVDDVGAAARFSNPEAVALDASGNVYVADSGNSLVRKITPAGAVSTVAGRAGVRNSADGPPGTASFGYMMGIAALPNGNLVVSEDSRLRIVAPDGTVNTLPVASSQPYSYFGAVAADAAGNIDVLDVAFGDIVTISPSGTVGRLKPNFYDGGGIAVDLAGNIFVTGREDHVVWKLSLDGTASIIGGLAGVRGSSDGVGVDARFENPTGVGVDASGNVYVSCSAYNSNTIRKGQAAGPPVITSQPQTQRVTQGSDALFSVTATGLPAPTYLWYFNGVSLGAMGSTLTISHAQASNAGDYTVVVSNAAGAVTSNKATLTVSSGPVTPPTNPSSGGGSGGGAPSLWFYLALFILAALRTARSRLKSSAVSPTDPVKIFSSIYFTCRALLVLGVASPAFAQSSAATPYSFTTLAGAAVIGSNDGPAGVARFNFPMGIAADSAGNSYVADTENNTIRKISPAGVVSTLAGKAGYSIDPNQGDGQGNGTGNAARFSDPAAVVVDGAGNVFVAGEGDNAIRKITPGGVVTTVAGGGPSSSFNGPQALTLDAAGNLYVADSQNFAIKKITPAGVVTTLAGGSSGTSDGNGSAAQFDLPGGIAVDSAGTVYVADTVGHTIRKISPTGDVTTFAGTPRTRGYADGAGTAALFNYPRGLAIDLAGNLYVADSGNCIVRKITPSGMVSTVAGAGLMSGHADGTGTARFFEPAAVALDPAGNLLVADHLDQTIRRITPSGVVSTIAGLSPFQYVGSNGGAGADARFNQPIAVAAGPTGDLYVADAQNHTIRKIAPNGFVVTFAGLAGAPGYADGNGATARFNDPNAVAADAAGNIYVADNGNALVRKITPDGTVTTVAGRAGFRGALDGPPGTAALGDMVGIAVRPNGNLVVSEQQAVREITPDGAIRSLSVIPVELEPKFGGIAVDAADNIYTLDRENGQIIRIAPSGSVTRIDPHFSKFAYFVNVWGIALDHAGNIFVTAQQCVQKVSIDGVTSIIGGLLDAPGSADGVGEEARFDYPTGIAVDAAGNVYVTCSTFNSNTIRKGQPAGAPVITSQPQSLTTARGSNAQFSVTATGFPAPTYQWSFNGAPFNGATASTLSLANVQSTDAGDYTVVATNSVGTVTSNKATLTVSTGPVTPPTTPSSGGGGGGGAPSLWFFGGLIFVVIIRLATHRGSNSRSRLPPCIMTSR